MPRALMRILAIDTTGAFGSIALREHGRTMEEVPLHSPDGFSQVLFGQLRRLLDRHDWDIQGIQCFAAATGPGSFTGVRIGVAAAKGLADATGAAAIGVSNLQSLAAHGEGRRRAVIIDARRGEIYGAVYDSDLNVLNPEVVMPVQQWLQSIQPPPDEIISTDLTPFRAILPAGITAKEQRSLASSVAAIAESRLAEGDVGDPLVMDANYVRRSDAELFWRDK